MILRSLLLSALMTSILLSGKSDFHMHGNIDLTSQYYPVPLEGKHSTNITTAMTMETDYKKDALQVKSKLFIQQDFNDYIDALEGTERTFARIDEFYATYDFENSQILTGKNIRFWGVLEVRNITDVFNINELRADPFYKDKLGSYNLTYTYFTDNGEISTIVKLREESRHMADFSYVYYFFPENAVYRDELLSEDSLSRPSVYLKYSDSTDTKYTLDYSIIFENGYDSQRYFSQTPAGNNRFYASENAYLVNKLLTYNTLVVDNTLIKLEAVYADVIDNEQISNYFQFGLGLEYTLSQFYNDADMGLLAEYYNYTTLEDDKRDDLALFEIFQNDLFIGLRYSFNKGNDASIVTGTILDMEYDEQVYYLEYTTRIAAKFRVNFDYRFVNPSQDYQTAFNLMGEHERVSLKLSYFF